MPLPQTGIFALGNLAHAYIEFDLVPGAGAEPLVAAAAGVAEPRTTLGGINLVTGVRPELWAHAAPATAPEDVAGFSSAVAGFSSAVAGPDGYAMPATQHDLLLWIAGGSYDARSDPAPVACGRPPARLRPSGQTGGPV